jgi:TonB family protein
MIAWLVYALAFSALLALAALAAEALLRMYGRPTRWVWTGAIVLSCAGPLALAERPREVAVSFAPAAPASVEVAAAPAVRRAPPLSERAEKLLPALWMATSALLVAGIAAGVAVLWRRRRGWRAARLANVPVLLSHEVGPAVVGVVRPAIVVPRWTLEWAEPMQRLVVRHEGEHIRARDPLLILAATVAAALVPWNLAVWFQLRRLRLAVEVDCDARTLRGGGDVATYGDLLLRVGARGSAAVLASAAFAEPRSFLERRIRAMTDRTPRNRAARAAACAVLTLGVAATGYALPAPAHPALFASLFPAGDADPIRVRAALTQPDTTPIYDIGQVERKPSLRNASEIQRGLESAYPPRLRDAGISGTARVTIVVRPDGSVSDVRVVSTTEAEFAEPARAVASTMRFSPAQMGGEAVGVRVELPITFQPRGTAASMSPAVSPSRGSDGVAIYDISQVEVKPSLRNAGEVSRALHGAYPVRLREAGTGGTATVEMVVLTDGSVSQTRLVNATDMAFAEPALRVATAMRFSPAQMQRAPVRVRVQVPMTFQPAGGAATLVTPGGEAEPSRSQPGQAVTVPSRRAVRRADTVLMPSTTTGEVLPASAGISTRGWTPSRTTAPTRARPRSLAPAQTTVMVTTAPTRAVIGVAPARTTVLTTTVPTRRSSRAVTTAVAPARVATRAQTSTLVTTARTIRVAPARATTIAPAGARPSRARKADPTPELLGRVIDPNAPRVPPAPAQP